MATPLPADLSKVDSEEAWKAWTPTIEEPWDRKRAAHLFRRGGFGATPAQIETALKDGFAKTLGRLLSGTPESAGLTEFFTETGEEIRDPFDLRRWWVRMMLEGGHPLREKLTLFWHNHFATSYGKIKSSELMFNQNVTLRKHALGKFRPFLLDMSKDTAMLIWLDSNQNKKQAANENFARELMELFSLGVGNYTEKDIREAARAFTGWYTSQEVNHEKFVYQADEHDEGMKTVFGQTGNWNGEDIVRICSDQPACARFLVGKLYAYLVSEAPPPKGLLAPLEERFRKSDYDIGDLVKAMLGSRFFFSAHAYHKRVKWPVEYVLEAYLAITPSSVPPRDFVDPLAKMGQVLFSPPNVKGWRTGTDWLNSATLLARNNFAETVALGEWSRPTTQNIANAPVPEEVPTVIVAYSESSAAAIVGGPGTAAVSKSFAFVDGPDDPAGLKHIVIPPKAGKAANQAKSNPPPVPPPAKVDPIVTLYASKPKDIPALVARMSDLLYGDRLAPAQMAKIEKFLHEPLMTPQAAAPQPKGGPGRGKKEPAVPPQTEKAPVEAKAPSTSTKAPDLNSPEFKARVREALHAMMCLPEYQLN